MSDRKDKDHKNEGRPVRPLKQDSPLAPKDGTKRRIIRSSSNKEQDSAPPQRKKSRREPVQEQTRRIPVQNDTKKAEKRRIDQDSKANEPVRSTRQVRHASPEDQQTVIYQDSPTELYDGKVTGQSKRSDNIKGQQRGKLTSLFKPRDKKPNFVLSILLTVIKLAFVAVIVFVSVGVGSVIGVANAYLETTPELDTGKIEEQKLTSYIYDQDSNLLATYSGAEDRDWASIDEIPEDLQNAIIAVEDRRFFEHGGVDFRRLAGAFAANLSSGTVEGGSTITQQLVKNKLLTNERSYKRKLQEAYLSMKLEEKYSKNEILEAYLNTIPLGGKVYGVKTAARDYFGKELDQLTLKETVCIAAITQSTTKFNPRRATYTKPEDLPYLINRMNMITERMYWADMISEEQYNETYMDVVIALDKDKKELELQDGYLDQWKQEMNILEVSPSNKTYKYPHFVEYVIHDVQTAILQQKGLEDTQQNRLAVDHEMRAGGYNIYATIDPKIQETVQDTLANWENYPDFQNPSDNTVVRTNNLGNPEEIPQPQAAAVVVENDTGYLKAIVGSREEPIQKLTFNRAYEGQMQVGSSIKPLSVYGPALNIGNSLVTSIPNFHMPVTGWEVTGSDPGFPQTNKGPDDPVSLEEAVVRSWNIASARTLSDIVTIDTSLDYLEMLGVDTSRFENSETGISNKTIVGLALGSAPITPIEMASAYSVIPRGGEYLQPVSFNLVQDSDHNDVINMDEIREKHEAFRQSTTWMLNEALVAAVDHGTGTNAKLDGMTTAGKTGTVVQNKGAYFAGYTPYYSAALWVGHDDYKSFVGGTGGEICAPIWRTFMQKIHEGKTNREIFPGDPSSYGMVKGTVCIYSNMKPTSSCTASEEGWMAMTDIPMEECNVCGRGVSSGVLICRETGKLATGYCPDTYAPSSRSYQPGSIYYEKYGAGNDYSAPTDYCDIHTEEWYNEEMGIPDEDDPNNVDPPDQPTPDPPPDPDPPIPEE